MQRSILIKAGVALALLWGVVLAVAKISGDQRVTPESVREFLAENTLEPAPSSGRMADADKRREVIKKFADQVNRLNWKQREEFRKTAHDDGELGRVFFENMSAEEKIYYIQLTVDSHFKSVMDHFNKMEKSERANLIRKIRKDMESDDEGRRELERLKQEDEEVLEKIVEGGMRSYYRDANADVKLDLAPLMQQMQKRLQGLHRRDR